MLGKKLLLGIIVVLIVSIFSFGLFFYFTGGMALVRVVQNYLIPDIPNREYSWNDFTDRREGQKISGFYTFGNKDSFSMWTLSGLKTFYKNSENSLFNYSAICEAIDNANSSIEGKQSLKVEEIQTDNFDIWKSYMKRENFVTVQTRSDNKNIVYVVWSMSGKYNRLKVIDLETCK